MQKTPYHSFKLNQLPKGCQLCVQGNKSVFFITGICSENCFYCPISDQKKNKDVIYINEWPTKEYKIIKKEISLCKSQGIGITGGDPLARLDRTTSYIKKLKKDFGKAFHVHLYTPLTLVSNESLKKLYIAGLDEIRFHPNLKNKTDWNKLNLANNFKWKIGIEIPVIPGKEKITKELIDYSDKYIDFLNLNELEYSDTNNIHLEGFKTKNNSSYAIKDSEKLAFKLLKYIEKNYPKLSTHYCTAKLKDNIQMRKRIKKRAESIKKPYDRISQDGTLIRGAIYLKSLYPEKNHENKLKNLTPEKRNKIIKELKEVTKLLQEEFNIQNLALDKNKLRILTSEKIIKNLAKQIDPKLIKLATIEEYPTYDEFLVEIDFLQ